MKTSVRALIAQALARICGAGQTLDNALQEAREQLAAPAEAAYLQECLYGVLRRYFRLNRQLDGYLDKPLKPHDLPVRMLLLAGLNELLFMSTPPYAAVDQTVGACAEIGRPWAKGLVNAILRRALRARQEPAVQQAEDAPELRYDHPAWLIMALQQDWPTEWADILNANNARAPLTLRVNTRRVTRAAYLQQLAAAGCPAQPTLHSDVGVVLEAARPVTDVPGFAAGYVSVQDEAAQLAAALLDCRSGQRVLDACAAPGGKTAHLLERTPGIELLAIDVSKRRLVESRANLARLGLTCALEQRDARTLRPEEFPESARCERILLDAPCSATGVIRRHPDIKIHRTPADIVTAAARQHELLSALWPLLASGGRLLYATCSVLRAENDEVLDRFLATAGDTARCVPVQASWGAPTRHGRQILPGQSGMDGFYYALLEKTAQSTS